MRPEYQSRWKEEIKKLHGVLKTPNDLTRRAVSAEDFIDTAVIGGISVADLIEGKISESQIPQNVRDAFEAQYPQHTLSFAHAVQRLSGHPDQVQGLINGVKGKLFEINYVDYLNHGHLPDGLTAELAHNATNPAWDIVIHDQHGHVAELVQLKATASLSYVHEAIAAHPNIEVVVPHDMYEQMANHPELFGHVLDSHQNLSNLTEHVSDAAAHAEAAGVHFHLPIIAIAFVSVQNYKKYRKGDTSLADTLRNVAERSFLAVVASGAGWAASAIAHKTIAGIPFAMTARMFGGQLLHNRDRRKVLEMKISIITASRECLQRQLSGSNLGPVSGLQLSTQPLLEG